MIEKILAKNNFDEHQKNLIRKSFEFAKKAHEGQTRLTGEPYINHPVAVAQILTNLKLDGSTIAAALLHDTVEDTPATIKEIEKSFGKDISFLVSGVTKLAKIEYKKQIEEKKQNIQVQNLRKMFFAMAEDLRVILIKLADRFHNMQTIASLPPDDRQRIGLETLEIYGPIAERLGMGRLRGELEDLAFPHAYPKEHDWLMQKVKDKYEDRERYLVKIKPKIEKMLTENGIKIVDAHSRAKHRYSLYKKIVKKEYDVSRVYDLVALRIVLPSVVSCYEALGVIHKNYKPLPGLIKDYIALPKPNGYQSIHTTIFCEKGKVLEIQLRTPEMHEHAENGIAAHWSYGESGKNKKHTANLKETAWVSQLKKWAENSDDLEFFKSLKTNFFSDRIFVLTPKGDVKDLPEGSTPLDFAYAVHTGLGHATKGAKVNGKLVNLDHKLKSGEVVEIIKTKNSRPTADWLRIIKSREAKKKIRAWFGAPVSDIGHPAAGIALPFGSKSPPRQQTKSSIEVGQPKDRLNVPIPKLPFVETKSQNVFRDLESKTKSMSGAGRESALGRHILSSTAKCCSPLPGQSILGYITKQRGISVHHADCPNLKKLNPNKIMRVSWGKEN